jgi:hypothetical protein
MWPAEISVMVWQRTQVDWLSFTPRRPAVAGVHFGSGSTPRVSER